MSVAHWIEAKAGELGEPVETVTFGYVVGAEYTKEVEKMIGQDISWSDVRDVLDVPLNSRHLPPIRADTRNWTLFVLNEGNVWHISRFPRPRAR
jgi:hypothetical protein